MHHQIYFGSRRLILAESLSAVPLAQHTPDKVWTASENGPQALQQAVEHLKEGHYEIAVVQGASPDGMLENLKQHFLFIEAAGGLVQNTDKAVLLIYRKGKWDLPKGKLDPGETLEACAVREVMEETGIEPLQLEAPLCRTYHTYVQDGTPCLKVSHWYRMSTPFSGAFTPQLEEDIESCIWAQPAQLSSYMNQTHPSIRDVLQKAFPRL